MGNSGSMQKTAPSRTEPCKNAQNTHTSNISHLVQLIAWVMCYELHPTTSGIKTFPPILDNSSITSH